MPKTKSWNMMKILVAIAYLCMVTVNALANTIPINGKNTGQVSDSYQNLFAPAGIAFAIWGVIYVLLAMYVLYQFGFLRHHQKISLDLVFKTKEKLFVQVPFSIYFGWITIATISNATTLLVSLGFDGFGSLNISGQSLFSL